MICARAIVVALVVLASAPAMSGAQTVTPRVSIVSTGVVDSVIIESVVDRLRELGWNEGVNVRIDRHLADGHLDTARFRKAAAHAVATKPSVIVAMHPYAYAAVREATRTIPTVTIDLENDPVARGFAVSLARPGGNVTGIFLDLPGVSGKHVDLIMEAVPSLKRVAILSEVSVNTLQAREAVAAATARGLVVQLLEIRRADDLDAALRAASAKQAQAIILLSSPLVFAEGAQIARLAIASRIPSISLFSQSVENGVLISYGPDLLGLYRQLAGMTDRVLRGAHVGEIPIERPSRFDLVLNAHTAQALGLALPKVLLFRADRIIGR